MYNTYTSLYGVLVQATVENATSARVPSLVGAAGVTLAEVPDC